jgi:hypothetical protein
MLISRYTRDTCFIKLELRPSNRVKGGMLFRISVSLVKNKYREITKDKELIL